MLISVPKCAVLSSDHTRYPYTLNGAEIPWVSSTRDLGVVMTGPLDFDIHIFQVVKSANVTCNMILRCFIGKFPQFYIHLYKSLVIPNFLYCSEVWRPYLKKHIDAIEKVQSNFIRRVIHRCNIVRPNDDILSLLPSIAELHHDAADRRLFRRLCSMNVINKFVSTRQNRLRSGCCPISSLTTAKSERVNNMFSWRLPRMLRSGLMDQH
jgi:hypothetical protein